MLAGYLIDGSYFKRKKSVCQNFGQGGLFEEERGTAVTQWQRPFCVCGVLAGFEDGLPSGVVAGEDFGEGVELGHLFFELGVELIAGLGGGGGLAAGDFLGGVEVVEVVEVGDHGLEFGGVVAGTAGEVEVGVVVELVGGKELGDEFLEVVGKTAVETEGVADDGVFNEGREDGAVIEVGLTGFDTGGFEGGCGLLAGFDGFFTVYVGVEGLLLEGEGGLNVGKIVAVLGK